MKNRKLWCMIRLEHVHTHTHTQTCTCTYKSLQTSFRWGSIQYPTSLNFLILKAKVPTVLAWSTCTTVPFPMSTRIDTPENQPFNCPHSENWPRHYWVASFICLYDTECVVQEMVCVAPYSHPLRCLAQLIEFNGNAGILKYQGATLAIPGIIIVQKNSKNKYIYTYLYI